MMQINSLFMEMAYHTKKMFFASFGDGTGGLHAAASIVVVTKVSDVIPVRATAAA
jgi:hypothetical protein